MIILYNTISYLTTLINLFSVDLLSHPSWQNILTIKLLIFTQFLAYVILLLKFVFFLFFVCFCYCYATTRQLCMPSAKQPTNHSAIQWQWRHLAENIFFFFVFEYNNFSTTICELACVLLSFFFFVLLHITSCCCCFFGKQAWRDGYFWASIDIPQVKTQMCKYAGKRILSSYQ